MLLQNYVEINKSRVVHATEDKILDRETPQKTFISLREFRSAQLHTAVDTTRTPLA